MNFARWVNVACEKKNKYVLRVSLFIMRNKNVSTNVTKLLNKQRKKREQEGN